MVEIDKSVTQTFTTEITTDFKWVSGETEPETPDGYERAPELDLDFCVLGKLWGFLKVS